MRYYISDLHFGHSALNCRMDNRGFETVEAMDNYMIKQWNSRVHKNDEVVILGDFAVYTNPEKVNKLLSQLKGKKYLVVGNHDKFIQKKGFRKELLVQITPYLEMHDNGRKVILSHYPIMCYNGQYRWDKNGDHITYMLYGHVHNTYDYQLVKEYRKTVQQHKREIRGSQELEEIPCQMINCFCMFSDYIPLTLDEWIDMEERKWQWNVMNNNV